VLTELFSLGVTAEALRAKTDRKSAISVQHGQFDTKFQVEGDVPNQSFCTVSEANEYLTSYNFVADSFQLFTQRNFVADFLQAKCDFRRKMAVLRF